MQNKSEILKYIFSNDIQGKIKILWTWWRGYTGQKFETSVVHTMMIMISFDVSVFLKFFIIILFYYFSLYIFPVNNYLWAIFFFWLTDSFLSVDYQQQPFPPNGLINCIYLPHTIFCIFFHPVINPQRYAMTR